MPLTNWSIRHAVTIYVFVVVLVAAGLNAYQGLPREAAPDITIPVVLVSTPWFGVSPADIESLVTNPLEEELEQLKDVREIRSTSAEGASIISIEFEPTVDIDDALQKIRDRVDAAAPELPDDAEDPIISEISFSEFPVMVVNISGDVGLLGLKQIGEELQDEIERIPGTLDVTLVGGLEREITVEADPAQLDYYRVTLGELTGALQGANINLPGGSLDVGDDKLLVRVPAEFDSVTEIEDVVIRDEDGQPIYVRDVATVIDGYEEISTMSRLDGTQSVSISISRRAGENIIEITDEAKRIVAEFDERYGGAVEFTVLADVSNNIRVQLDELENNILTGLILVFVVLLFFMGGMRNALFVASAIPLSMLMSFAILSVMDVTLNIVVLFSLVLALGMLVDNAIVVVENVYRHGTMGKPLVQAAMDGVGEVAWPIISSTATTVFAFFPLLFWPGIMGEFMYFMPLTVMIVLASSLFVALVINPVFCATLMYVRPPSPDATPEDAGDELSALPRNLLYRMYGGTLRFAVRNRFLTTVVTIATFFGTMWAFGQYSAGVEFFPTTTPERIFVNVTLPDGSNVEASDRIVRQVEELLVDEPLVESMVADIGAGNGDQMSFGADGTAPHRSRITVEFIDRELQEESPFALIDRLRVQLQDIPGAEFEIQAEEGGPPQSPPVNVEIVGREYEDLGRIAAEAFRLIESVDGVTDLKDDFETSRSEITVEVDREEAARVDVSVFEVADTVRSAVNGVTASTFRDADDEYDIIVRMAEEYRDSIDDIAALTVSNADGDLIPLTEVASVHVRPGFGSIRHVDGERVVTLSSDVRDGFNDVEVLTQVQDLLANELNLPSGYELRYTGQNADQAEAAEFLGNALLAALFLIGLVLVTQFNSITQPMIILGSVVLSLLGVLWGLLITHTPFNIIMTGVGIISLAGVVVNNAIVLIDYTNQLKDRGMESREAIVTAGMVRLRPVLLTAVTTALSLLPTVFGFSLDTKNLRIVQGGTSVEMWGPMANAVVAGLLVATFLTLVVVPVMYSIIDSMGGWFRSGPFRRRRRVDDDDTSDVRDDVPDDVTGGPMPAAAPAE